DVPINLLVGAALIEAASERATGTDAERLLNWAKGLREEQDLDARVRLALDGELAHLMARYPDRRFATAYGKELGVTVDREKARYSAWYEMFPRSCAAEPGKHGTFRDLEARLPYIAGMGFDVLYLPPIHPVGQAHRKGKNNSPTAEPGDVGSP